MVPELKHHMTAGGKAINTGGLGTPVRQLHSNMRQAHSSRLRISGATIGGKANGSDSLRITGWVIMIGSPAGQVINGNHEHQVISEYGAFRPKPRCSRRQARAGFQCSQRQ